MAWNCVSWRGNQTCGLFGAVAAAQPLKWIVLVLWISRRQKAAGSMCTCVCVCANKVCVHVCVLALEASVW